MAFNQRARERLTEGGIPRPKKRLSNFHDVNADDVPSFTAATDEGLNDYGYMTTSGATGLPSKR